MIRTLIIEDEPHAQKELQALLSLQEDFIWIGCAATVEESVTLINNVHPDLILLDIHLKDGTAFDILDSLSSIPFKIIFVTAHDDHAIKAIKLGALDYLLKPVDKEEFFIALDRFRYEGIKQSAVDAQIKLTKEYWRQSSSPTRNGKIALRDQYQIRFVALSDIIYCQNNNGYTTFFLTDGKQIVVSRPIKEHEHLLPDEYFLRVHQSYLVNIEYVETYHKEGYIILKNGKEIPVSVRKRDSIVKQLTMTRFN